MIVQFPVDKIKVRFFILLLLVATAWAAGAPAQELRVHAVDSLTAAPLRGALVALLDANSRVVAEVLTSPTGFGSLSAPAGVYRVRVRRIGYRPYVSSAVVLPGVDRLTISVPGDRIVLTTVVISARSRCSRISTGTDGLGTVWGEVVKALQAARLTMDDLQGVGRAWTYRKTTNRLGEVEKTDTTSFVIRSQRPFGAVHPNELARAGYVIGDEESGWTYYGPDETVLLSPSFADTHCFKLVRDPAAPGIIGLSFAPVPGRRIPEIAGVAWIDQTTSELQRITFKYVNAGLVSRFGGGGETRFRRLASGAWLVSEWYLRMPRIERVGAVTAAQGFEENGGGLLAPRPGDGR